MCFPEKDYQKINPNTQLMVIAECASSCFDSTTATFQFSVSQQWNIVTDDPQLKWIECVKNTSSIFGGL
jgi:hypothetical protein